MVISMQPPPLSSILLDNMKAMGMVGGWRGEERPLRMCMILDKQKLDRNLT
jgi:hypothetical protein